MNYYDPSKTIDPDAWLKLDESVRLSLIEQYVLCEEKEIDDSIFSIHPTAHMIVEKQFALGVKDTVNAYDRLRHQGLKRHDTIHALAAILLEGINQGMANADLDVRYKSRLRKITAKMWLKGKY